MRRLLILGLMTAATAGCADGGGEGPEPVDAICEAEEQERFDPSTIHLLPGAAEPEYLSDPPTSGPHQPGPARSGVLDEPLSRPVQVGQLEAGAVLLQHDDQLPDDQLTALEALAGDRVIVAPNPDLPAPVVATAWTVKLQCQAVDVAALTEFVADHRGQSPGFDG